MVERLSPDESERCNEALFDALEQFLTERAARP
jgi:hypothetical protein